MLLSHKRVSCLVEVRKPSLVSSVVGGEMSKNDNFSLLSCVVKVRPNSVTFVPIVPRL